MKPPEWGCSEGSARTSEVPAIFRGVMRLRWLIFLCLSGYAILFAAPVLAAEPTHLLRSAQFLPGSSATPPPNTAAWQRVSLPDNWNLSRPGVGGFGWYRMTFDLPRQPDSLYAIYVRKLSMTAGFYVNGTFIGDGG